MLIFIQYFYNRLGLARDHPHSCESAGSSTARHSDSPSRHSGLDPESTQHFLANPKWLHFFNDWLNIMNG